MGRVALAATAVGLSAATAVGLAAPATAASLNVPATANIFGAGHGAPPSAGGCAGDAGSAGTPPPSFGFAPGSGKVLTVSSVTGLTQWGGSDPPEFPPDGDTALGQGVDSTAGISGIDDTVSRLGLTGVFLTDAEPVDPAPSRLSFGSHGFATLSPQVEQGFFIGDGRTGTGSGAVQKFNVPSGATRLFLGFMDGFDFVGSPGCYHDNSGSLSATFAISGTPPPPPRGPAVASVVEIKKLRNGGQKRAFLIRHGQRLPLSLESELQPGDRVRTNGNTKVAIEFDLGGRAVVNSDSEIKIVGERSAQGTTAEQIRVKEGGVWAKCGQMKESIEIQTTGGIVGIKG